MSGANQRSSTVVLTKTKEVPPGISSLWQAPHDPNNAPADLVNEALVRDLLPDGTPSLSQSWVGLSRQA